MLSSFKRIIAVLTICTFASGCSSYRVASLPNSSAAESGNAKAVESGNTVRATLISGETIEGKVTAATEDSLTVGQASNFGQVEQSIAASEIAQLEVEHWSDGSKIAVYSAAGLLVVGAIAAASYGDGLEEGLGGSN